MELDKERTLRAGTIGEVRARGCVVVTGFGHAIAVFKQGDRFSAVDNRCPHMGFPLDRGTLKDGILTCHWHHARFDVSSGGTFDPFADDVQTYGVSVKNGEVLVHIAPSDRDPVARWSSKLEEGMEHNIRLVIAKSVIGLDASGADYRVALGIGADFGTKYSDQGWGAAMTMMTCTANIYRHLRNEDRPRALYQGIRQVSAECMGMPPRFMVDPLPTSESRVVVFKDWFRAFIDVRDDEGAERCLRTAIDLGASERAVADMVFAAVTDHIYLDAGHVLDLCNKAFELLDHIGWEHASQVLTSLVLGIAHARRSEELNSWRNPIDLVSLVWDARDALPQLWEESADKRGNWADDNALADVILGDDPVGILDALQDAVRDGATAERLGSVVAYAAFVRMARFHTSNEFGDWDTVHNTLTAANALHQALKRAPSVELLRAVFDTAMSIYLDRFLNMPAQRIPEPDDRLVSESEIGEEILDAMNSQQQVERAARLVSDYVTGAENPDGVLGVLSHAMLREDSTFHHFQIVDAAVKQYEERKGRKEEQRHVLIAATRFLAAHYPTPRASDQTYNIAVRLQRGEELYRDGG